MSNKQQATSNKQHKNSYSVTPTQQGVTLVELMVTVAVASALLFVAVPLTRSWVDGAHVDSAVSAFKNATLQGKIAALRNKHGVPRDDVAALVCRINDADTERYGFRVYTADDTANSCTTAIDDNLIHIFSINENIQISSAGAEFSCFAFNSSGLLLAEPGCSTNTIDFVVKKNDEEYKTDAI